MKNAKILIVEDESIVALDIRSRLQSMGFQVLGNVSTGDDAIRMVEQTNPDLILMDIKIKGPMDGVETAEKIRSKQDIPIIYLTAFANDTTIQRAKITGPSGYILKPFEERELSIAIEMALYKHEMEIALKASDERYMLALQGAHDGIWDWDLTRNHVYFSPRCEEMLGCDPGEINSSLDHWPLFVHPEDRLSIQTAISHHLDGLTDHLECECRMMHKNGKILWVRLRGLAISNPGQRPHRIAGSISDITNLKNVQEQLIFDAYHDALTKLPNRALFMDRLEHAMEHHKRHQTDNLAVLFLDIDQFKVVNDSLGHLAGDQFLIDVAHRLQKMIRACDTVARLGGDEYVILLEGVKSQAYACNVAERILEILKIPVQIGEHELCATGSIGIVMVCDDHQQPADVLKDADIAMYRAKSLGKNRFELFDIHLRHKAEERLLIENCLTGALERGELVIHYQPIYSLISHQIVGVEALLRLYPKGGSLIPPSVFIPVAEEIGLIKDIGDWVLLNSCQMISDWHRRYPDETPLNLHVNISVKQLCPEFVARMKEILETTQIDPSRLRLEITENIFMENVEQLSAVMEQLSMLGVQMVIDDFGTGYSSLGYLRRFPIDTIKLDQSFILRLQNDRKNLEFIKAIVMLATQLGLDTIAEGVETEEQEECLAKMKCHFGQGFLFSKPLNIDKMEELLDRSHVKGKV